MNKSQVEKIGHKNIIAHIHKAAILSANPDLKLDVPQEPRP